MVLRWLGLAILLLVLGIGAAGYRYVQILPYPMGGGRYEDSPNGQFTANASNVYDENFWGSSRNYYEFDVRSKKGNVLRSVQLPGPPNPIYFREGTGRIMWASDSTSVSFGTSQDVIWTTPVP